MPKLSDTQTILLSTAANRDDGSLLPLPEGLKTRGAALDRTLNSLLRRGMIRTVTTASAEKMWKDGGADDGPQCDSTGTGLVITSAGFAALGIEPSAMVSPEKQAVSVPDTIEPDTPVVVADTPRPGGKLGAVIDAIARPEGASLDELTALSGWLPHTTRAAVTRLRQRGHDVTLRKIEGRKAYHLAAKA